MEIQEGVALGPFTTFGIGGPARFFARAASVADIYQALEFAKEKGVKVFILGGGSNVLVADEGFDGLVIKIEITGVEIVHEDEGVLVAAGAGENWDTLVERTVREKWWGIENLSGVPGTVGGAVVQNIGAYGASLSQTLEWVEVLDTLEQKTTTLTASACKLGYRDSIFKQEPGRYIVLHAALRLSTVPTPNISYKDLAEKFAGVTPSIADVRDALLLIRKNKFPDLAVEGTAGSFFKNPIVSAAEAQKLQNKYPSMPVFAIPESTDIKIPLAWLLDYRHGVLDMRDVRVGSARLFEKQFLVIAAAKNSSARDVRTLAELVQKKLFDVCAISVEPEVFFVV